MYLEVSYVSSTLLPFYSKQSLSLNKLCQSNIERRTIQLAFDYYYIMIYYYFVQSSEHP